MKKLFFLLVTTTFVFFACNNSNKSKQENADKNCEAVSCKHEMMTVDSLLANLESYVDSTVSVCGKCTHICSHGGRNIFIASKEDLDKTIFGKAGDGIDRFDEDLEGENIHLKGILRAVKVEQGEEVESHHDVEIRYYIEVSEAKICCCDNKKDPNHKCCEGKKDPNHKCCGEKHEHNHE